MSLPVFGKGRPRKPQTCVEDVPRLYVYDLKKGASPPLGPLARETTIRLVINGGAEVAIDVVRDARFFGGDGQRFFLCPTCSRKVQHLYLRHERLACRQCSGLDYASRHTRRRGLHRVRNLRRRLGAPAALLSPLPSRPKRWRRDHWARALAALAVAEGVVAAELRAMIPRVRRRLKRDRHSDSGA